MFLQDLINEPFQKWREAKLRRRLIRQRSNTNLAALLRFLLDKRRPLAIQDLKLREAIFGVPSWEMEPESRAELFKYVEQYLCGQVELTQSSEWRCWLEASRALGREPDVAHPTLCAALKTALDSGKLNELSPADHKYLLECFRRRYEHVLDLLGPEEQGEALPLILELAALGELFEQSETTSRLHRLWAGRRRKRPRALSELGDEEAERSPLRGVGSPHGIHVTLYHSPDSDDPVRICCAGLTPDPTLNTLIGDGLFAVALACETEPTLITSVGSVLSPGQRERGPDGDDALPLLSAVIGVGGPAEPGPHAVSLGMEVDEALAIFTDLVSNSQDVTGLVKVSHCGIDEADELERRIARTLEDEDDRVHIINSDPAHAGTAGAVNFMPLLHRDGGRAVPVEVEIPYRALGAKTVYSLLREVRDSYIQQLVAAGRRREALARNAHESLLNHLTTWNGMPEAARERLCEEHPLVHINQVYDFDLGVIRPQYPPVEIDRRLFMETRIPEMCEHALIYQRRFDALCEKLESINREGGSADIVTMKMLVDSMLRQAPLPVDSEEFQREYRRWVERCHVPAWAAIEDWATRRGMRPETLAADNVFFNATLDAPRQVIVIQPWVAFDLYDFVARIDCRRGLLEVFPAGKSPTLAEALVPDAALGVGNLKELHEKFCEWFAAKVSLKEAKEKEFEAAEEEIRKSRTVSEVLQLLRGKNPLLNGHALRAARVFDEIRSLDLAAIYFWGAVTHQYLYLEEHFPAEVSKTLRDVPGGERPARMIEFSINSLIKYLQMILADEEELSSLVHEITDLDDDDLRRMGAARKGVPRYQLLLNIVRESFPLDEAAESYLNQLRAKDPEFIKALMGREPDINVIEVASLGLSPDEQRECEGARLALHSLELLKMAEQMGEMSAALPFSGSKMERVRLMVERIIEMQETLDYGTPSCASQIRELPSQLGTRERGGLTAR